MEHRLTLLQRKQAMEDRRNQGLLQPERVTRYYLDAYLQHLDEMPLLREARALKALWSAIDLPLYVDEVIAGSLSLREPVGFFYGSATWIDRELADLYCRQNNLTEEQKQVFGQELAAVEAHRYHAAEPSIFTDEENANIQAHAATSTWFGGHMVLDFERILTDGLDAYARAINIARAGSSDQDFYDAMKTMLDAVVLFIERYADRADAMAARHGSRFIKMAADLRHIAHFPASSFQQGLQLVWLIHLLNGADSFGRFDSYLRPLFLQDRTSGVLSREDALYWLQSFWIKVEEVNQIQNMTIGGVEPDGQPTYSELTELCLVATYQCGYKGPNLCLRITGDMPDRYWEEALECLSHGQGLPALYHDSLYIRNLVDFGYPLEVARGYCLAGCSQVMLPGACNFINDIGMHNLAKVFEATLHDGIDPRTGLRMGLPLGKAQDFASFESLLEAFRLQVLHSCELEASINDKDTLYRRTCEGYTMRTLFMKDCITRGKGIFHGGARYNNIELEIIGITNCADSLYAMKRALYDERRITVNDLMQALERDYEGHELLRRYLLQLPKFGNDEQEVDALRVQITGWVYDAYNKRPSVIGGIYVPGEVIFTAHAHCGEVTGATPDGRKRGRVLADSAGAQQGMDMNGPTALLNSMLKLPTGGHLLTSTVLNIRFMATLFRRQRSREAVRSLLTSYFQRGGMQVQINVCAAEDLQKALEDPQSYRSLVVRVGGYSDYFVNLERSLQEEIIARTAHAV